MANEMRLIDANVLAYNVELSKHNNTHPPGMVRVNHRNEHDHFLKMIYDAPTVDAAKWIPVTERLPEKDQYVWCYSNKYGGHFFVGYRSYLSGVWMEGGCMHLGNVTHWMPLPEPPKGE